MIACDATISAMLHDEDGEVLNVGRRTRKPPARLRRAARERDRYRCRFPGCESRRTDLHHVRFWANGGETSIENIICMCKMHHRLVHTGRVMIAATGSGFSFYLANGTPVPSAPPPPGGSADAIPGCHDAPIAYHTIVPPHSGERLDLHEAIWACLNSGAARARRLQEEDERRQREHEQTVTLAA
jgi:hypothetical protein